MYIIDPEFFKANSPEEVVERFRALIGQYRSLSSTHITWFTHKNPYGCWICDLLLHCETACNYLDHQIQAIRRDTLINSKSSRPVDMSGNSHESNQDG